MTLRVATYNVNSVRARLSILVPWLEAVRPDVIALQETKVQDPDFPAAPFRDLGYQVVFRGQKSYNGVAVLSKTQPTEIAFGLDDGGPPDEARLVAVTVRGVRLVNTYIPQGRALDDPMYAYKLEWIARLSRLFARTATPKDRILWVGDFNVAPTDIDVHDPKRLANHVCFHAAVREALDRVRGWGFEDVFRRHVTEPNQYSFFDYRARGGIDSGAGWRVDHIWATPALARRSTAAWIDLAPRRLEGTSDHAPVLAEFDV